MYYQVVETLAAVHSSDVCDVIEALAIIVPGTSKSRESKKEKERVRMRK